MRPLLAIALAAMLSACATPYNSVYVNESGDYYIAETESTNYYYPNFASSGSLGYLGMYPWWEFSYYSPYFYPYHFAVWNPGRYYYHRGWYSGYYPYWCPPYRWNSPVARPVVADNRRPDPVEKLPLPPPVSLPAPSPGNVALIRDYEDLARRPSNGNSGAPVVLVRSQTVSGYSQPPRSSMPAYFPSQRSRRAYSQPQPSFSSQTAAGSSRAVSRSNRSSAGRASSSRAVSRSTSSPTVHRE